MKTTVTASEWQASWIKAYQVSIGNVAGYKRRLKELKDSGKNDNETQGKIRALQALILFS